MSTWFARYCRRQSRASNLLYGGIMRVNAGSCEIMWGRRVETHQGKKRKGVGYVHLVRQVLSPPV